MTGHETALNAPTLTVTGMHAVISNLTYEWHVLPCWKCRERLEVPLTSTGRVELGLSASRSRKTCRWYYRFVPGKPPVGQVPKVCANCGNDEFPFSTTSLRECNPSPRDLELHNRHGDNDEHEGLEHQAYHAIRVAFPVESAAADAYVQAWAG